MVTVGLMWIAMLMHGQAGKFCDGVCYGHFVSESATWYTEPQEPQDVPAVQVRQSAHVETCKPAPQDPQYGQICTYHWHTRWTCTDKRRALIKTEDGKHHCILFGGAQ